jgi:hypothetical protein
MLLYFGLDPSSIKDEQMNMFFKMISDLSLEYRTVYARLTQRKERRKRKTGGLISFAKNLQKGPSKTPKKDSESKQTPAQSQGKEVRPPSSGGGDLLETLAMTAINSKDERSKSGWRYRRKAQEKRHQKRKSIRRTLGGNKEEQKQIEELTKLLSTPS